MTLPVCVCVPVYNGGPTIRRTLSNLLEQDYKDFQVLVYDDGSRDRTAEFVSQLAENDSRIRLMRGETNVGRGAARNRLLELAGDSLVAWQDADDLWHPSKLREQLKAREVIRDQMGDDSFVLISSYSTHKIGRAGSTTQRHLPPESYDVQFLLGPKYRECPFQLQAVLGPASTFISAGGFDGQLNWAEDVDICLKILRAGFRIVGHSSEEPLATYNHNLAKARGAVAEAAQAVLVERFRDFAIQNGMDIDRAFMRRAANYVAKIYMAHGRYEKALALNLRLLSSLKPDEAEQFNQVSKMILSIVHQSAAQFLADNQAKADGQDEQAEGSGARKPMPSAFRRNRQGQPLSGG